MEKRDRFIGVNSIRFYERFPNADACYRYIAEIKSGRGLDSKKRLVVVALEILEKGGVGRAYDRVVGQASSKEFNVKLILI